MIHRRRADDDDTSNRRRQRIAFPPERHTPTKPVSGRKRCSARGGLQKTSTNCRISSKRPRCGNQNKALTPDHAAWKRNFFQQQKRRAARTHATRRTATRKSTRAKLRGLQQRRSSSASRNKTRAAHAREGGLSTHAPRNLTTAGAKRGALFRDRRALFRESSIQRPPPPTSSSTARCMPAAAVSFCGFGFGISVHVFASRCGSPPSIAVREKGSFCSVPSNLLEPARPVATGGSDHGGENAAASLPKTYSVAEVGRCFNQSRTQHAKLLMGKRCSLLVCVLQLDNLR